MMLAAKWLRGTRESHLRNENAATRPYHQKSRRVLLREERNASNNTSKFVTRVAAGAAKNENKGRKSQVGNHR